jgi:hypothetical protein
MEQTAEVIKKTGLFDRVDKLYGDFDALLSGAGEAEAGAGGDAGAAGGDMGGGADMGATAEPAAEPAAAEPATTESFRKDGNLLTEEKRRKYEEKTKRYQGIYLRRLTESLQNNEHVYNLDSVEKDTDVLNSKISEMTKEIDKLTK